MAGNIGSIVGSIKAGPVVANRSPMRLIAYLHAAIDVFAHGLGIAARSARDHRHRQPLPVQLQYHHGFSKSDHRSRLPEEVIAPILALPNEPGLTPAHWATRSNNQGIFKAHIRGELHAH